MSGEAVYSVAKRHVYLTHVKHLNIRNPLNRLYFMMNETESMQHKLKTAMIELGRKYPEIRQFKKIPGIGDISAHIFNAYDEMFRFLSNLCLRIELTSQKSEPLTMTIWNEKTL